MGRPGYRHPPAEGTLGAALRAARKRRGYVSRLDFAAACGLAGATVQRLEHGRGHIVSLARALAVLGLEVAGPDLPPGASLGARLAALRERRGLSRRTLAGLLKVVPDTVDRLETSGLGRLDILERALAALGAEARLMPAGPLPPPPRAAQAGPLGALAERRRWGQAPSPTVEAV